MRLWHSLRRRLRSIVLRERTEHDLQEELQFHLERETERLEASGLAREAARRQARHAFGAVESTKDACRDARGTAWLDHLRRDVLYAGRTFRRAPLMAVTIVSTVGLGLGLVTVVFTVLNHFVFRADAVRDPYGLFALERPRPAGGDADGFTRAQYEALLHETAVFAEAFASTPEIDSWIEGRRLEGPLVTGNFFQVLGVGAALGRVLTPADEGPDKRPVLVLSHRAWVRHFAQDPGVLARTVQVNGVPFQVVGVMPADFRGLTVAPSDYWAPLALAPEFHRTRPGHDDVPDLSVVGRLRSGVTRSRALVTLRSWDTQRPDAPTREGSQAGLTLEPRPGTVPQPADAVAAFTPLFFAFGLVLLVGCANVANLLLARGVARQREIGVRLALGASRRRVTWQLLTESLLLALAAAGLGFMVARGVLAGIVYVATSTFPPDFGNLRVAAPPADWRVVLFLAGGALVSTLGFALAPALQATRIELVRAMRGEIVRDARPGRARSMLIALQVAGSTLLLVCAAIFLRSSWAAATVDPGIRTADVLAVHLLDEPRRAALLGLLAQDPSVAAVAASSPGLFGEGAALAEGHAGTSPLSYRFVSPEYFAALDIAIVRGRGFTTDERSLHDRVAVVSERTARQLWPGADAVGQMLRLEPDADRAATPPQPSPGSRAVLVVGVAREVAGFRLGGARSGAAGVYLPIDVRDAGTALTLRVRDDATRAQRMLADRFAAIDPNMAEVTALSTLARMEAYLLGIPFWLTLCLGGLALVLTLSGLFSVLSYLVEQRRREIGVRIALGASRSRIGALVLAQTARPVAIGVLVGITSTAALAALLLATPAAEPIGDSVRLFDPVAYGGSLLGILAACASAALVPALRAGRIDPIRALRQD